MNNRVIADIRDMINLNANAKEYQDAINILEKILIMQEKFDMDTDDILQMFDERLNEGFYNYNKNTLSYDNSLSGYDTLINKYKIAHSVAVAQHMKTVAEKNGMSELKQDVYYTLGLLHDIGYLRGRQDHEVNGYKILKELGMKEHYAKAVLQHGTDPYQLCEADRTESLALLQDADMSVDSKGKDVGFKERLKDIESRYGNDSTAYKTAGNTVKYLKEKYRMKRQIKKLKELDRS